GAEATYAIEALMHDGVALQAGTSHYFGDGFAKAFDIQFTNKDNKLQHVFQTSWGVTTRLIGAFIMVHGDDNGLVIPPRIAPTQVVIIPVAMHKPGVLDKAAEIKEKLAAAGLRVKMDDSEQSPGWKFAEYEMKGVPVRLEVGPRDIENNVCVIARRDTGEKITVSLDEVADYISKLLDTIHDDMYKRAEERRDAMTYVAHDKTELKEITDSKQGFIKTMWCGDPECEDAVREEFGVRSRCIPFQQENLGDKCVCCGKPAKYMLYWGKQS
ncbi:MAG: proline--tRNA ligase, partial [Clostridia bacterium]|nr:proline--tRNA ligase [Clostridia bacterium]